MIGSEGLKLKGVGFKGTPNEFIRDIIWLARAAGGLPPPACYRCACSSLNSLKAVYNARAWQAVLQPAVQWRLDVWIGGVQQM